MTLSVERQHNQIDLPSYSLSMDAHDALMDIEHRHWDMGDNVHPRDYDLMACYSLPIINHINEWKPDVAIGCDRGARLFSVAVRSMRRELTSGESFPTIDNTLHLTKITATGIKYKRRPELRGVMQERIKQIVTLALKEGEIRGRTIPEKDRPKVLFIDDWIDEGNTYHLIKSISDEIKIDASFAVMDDYDYSEDIISGKKDFMQWLERPGRLSASSVTGVDYDDNYQANVITYDRHRMLAAETRRHLHAAVKRVASVVDRT